MKQRRSPIPADEFKNFVAIVRRLRRDCPWDRKQTHRSLRHGLIEETYEVIETIDRGDFKELRNELGDLLLHVALHSIIAEEDREFTLEDVLREINKKLIRRHPHVFGKKTLRSASEVKRNWEKLKMAEGRTSVLEGVPRGMPALQRAQRLQERAANVGFDWRRPDDVWLKVLEELEELLATLRNGGSRRREEEFGDLLFALVNYSRFLSVNTENALRASTEKFIRRFHHIEHELRRRGRDIHDATLEEMDELWNQAKRKPRRKRHS